jgi:hypothetical protein
MINLYEFGEEFISLRSCAFTNPEKVPDPITDPVFPQTMSSVIFPKLSIE